MNARHLAGLFSLVLSLVTACAANVPQDKKTGSDGKVKGAKALTMDQGEAKASGIVTYPGGDRVDWKMIELPEKAKGTLDLKLTWTPPRPGLQLAFDVFDEWNTVVASSKKVGRKKSSSRSRTANVENAKGKYFVRVYAVGRGDAGKYKLSVDFRPELAGPTFDPTTLDIPHPPKLADVPAVEVPCDTFDKNNPSCMSECPVGAPPNWPGCAGKCPTPADIENPACWATMPCPKPPDRRLKKCPASVFPKCADITAPDPNNPNCDNAKADPVKGRVLSANVQGSDVIIQIGVGSAKGVAKPWRGQVLRGDTDSPLPGGDVYVVRVDKNLTVGKVKLTTDQLNANPYVKLSPP